MLVSHDSLGGQDTFQDSANRKCLHMALELYSQGEFGGNAWRKEFLQFSGRSLLILGVVFSMISLGFRMVLRVFSPYSLKE